MSLTSQGRYESTIREKNQPAAVKLIEKARKACQTKTVQDLITDIVTLSQCLPIEINSN